MRIRIQIIENVADLLEIQLLNNQDYNMYCLLLCAVPFSPRLYIFVTICLKKNLGFWLSEPICTQLILKLFLCSIICTCTVFPTLTYTLFSRCLNENRSELLQLLPVKPHLSILISLFMLRTPSAKYIIPVNRTFAARFNGVFNK